MVNDPLTEVIFVGLPGPTHHYSGLSPDNVASGINRGSVSNPLQAALQVLNLVRLLNSLGVATAILPPQLRPHLPLLRQTFSGDDDAIIKQASQISPALLDKASSASAMWTANAATVAPTTDCHDGMLHITAANLFSNLHRRIEADETCRVLKMIFGSVPDTIVHAPLYPVMGLYDEGAANHMRLAPDGYSPGLHVFVYGANGSFSDPDSARQTFSASQAIKVQHRIDDAYALFLRQNPQAIREGVFHNDVIAVSNGNVLLVHEQAYENGLSDIEQIEEAYARANPGQEAAIIVIDQDDLSIEEAVQCYFFNSQIVTRPQGHMAIIAPMEAKLLYEGRPLELMERICQDSNNPIEEIHTIDLRQSMRNGGGPACLRLRVQLTQPQLAALENHSGVMADDKLLSALERIIKAHYPKELTSLDLGNPALYHKNIRIMEELSAAMQLSLLPV